MQDLTQLICNSAVVLYFQRFVSTKLDRMSMSDAFDWTIGEVEQNVVDLIRRHPRPCRQL